MFLLNIKISAPAVGGGVVFNRKKMKPEQRSISFAQINDGKENSRSLREGIRNLGYPQEFSIQLAIAFTALVNSQVLQGEVAIKPSQVTFRFDREAQEAAPFFLSLVRRGQIIRTIVNDLETGLLFNDGPIVEIKLPRSDAIRNAPADCSALHLITVSKNCLALDRDREGGICLNFSGRI